ncbi:MAG: protein TolA [Burkholderiales bacterium RIFCSPLOWO2_02_FULL_57_36]|nr:MAG: protein TolA [Burkholderiales bacterium RIFCSPLOWO2_02_FULL_57_36]
MSDSTPYNMPKEPGRWRAILLATVVHAALFGLLWFGIRWQNETPVAVEAEVWSPQAREAAPRPRPVPEPEVKPKPTPPEPKPAPKEVPKPPVIEQPVDKPDIALEQEKKRIEEKKRLDDEKRKEKERQEKARLEEERQQKIAEQKAEEKRIEKEKQEKLAAAKKKADAEELKKKQAAEKLKEQIAAEEKAAEKRHQENLERMTAQAGTGGSGNAPKTQGGRADSDYAGRVGSKIKSNTIFNVSDALSGNPPVEYEVQLLPDGSLRSVRKVRPSGVPGFDEAVARAIERSSPFPPDRSGTVPSSFNVIHRPKDQ